MWDSSRMKRLYTLLLTAVVALGSLGVAQAADSATLQPVGGYGSNTTLQTGTIVRLKANDSSKVEPLTTSTLADMYGVVVPASAPAATLSDGSNAPQTFVATSGRYQVRVSDQNGAVKSGDYITISSRSGVGMKATGEQSLILGEALADLNSGDGLLPVALAIGTNPLTQTSFSQVPSVLRQVTESINNKPVTPWRIYVATLLLLLTIVMVSIILYGGISRSMVAAGRNPLAQKAINRFLTRTILAGLVVLAAGLAVIYALLKV